jgi:hypothetical protein
MFEGRLWPTRAAVHDQLVSNWLLLTYALLALTASNVVLNQEQRRVFTPWHSSVSSPSRSS